MRWITTLFFVFSTHSTIAWCACYVEAIDQMWFERFRHNIFNVHGSDNTFYCVCTLGNGRLDSVGRCTRSVVLRTSLKTFTRFFFKNVFFVCETIHKNTRVGVWSKCNTSRCQWDVCVPFFSTFAFAIKFRLVAIVANTLLAIWIGTFWIVHISSWSL